MHIKTIGVKQCVSMKDELKLTRLKALQAPNVAGIEFVQTAPSHFRIVNVSLEELISVLVHGEEVT